LDCWCGESWGTSEVDWIGLNAGLKCGCGRKGVVCVRRGEKAGGGSGSQGGIACCRRMELEGFVPDGIQMKRKGTIVRLRGSRLSCCMLLWLACRITSV